MPDAATVARVFDATFGAAYRVRIEGGAAEPLYVPAPTEGGCARLVFTRDYASSALHEAAHWCLAGARRRVLVDFGYDYVPNAQRDEASQRAFEGAEVRTQAIEWRLSLAACVPFHLSVDNLGRDRAPFLAAVAAEVRRRLAEGWPPRVECFAAALADACGGVGAPVWNDFAVEMHRV